MNRASERNNVPAGETPNTLRRNLARSLRGWARWLVPGVLLTLLPKCLVCVAGYVALASGLGLTHQELCGAAVASAGSSAAFLGLTGLSADSAARWSMPVILLLALLSTFVVRRRLRIMAFRRRNRPE